MINVIEYKPCSLNASILTVITNFIDYENAKIITDYINYREIGNENNSNKI
jgi:hypothetical protein